MQEREQPSFEEQYAQLPEVVHSYLEHVRVQKRLAERTHTLYALDLIKLQSFAQAAAQELLTLQPSGQGTSISRVQNPERSGIDDQSTVMLKAGQVMVLTGMARYKAKDNRRRLAEGWSLLAGGSDAQSLEREEFLVVVRPVLMN